MADVRKPTIDNFSSSGKICDSLNQRRNHSALNQINSISTIIQNSQVQLNKENSLEGIKGKSVLEALSLYKAHKNQISSVDDTFTTLLSPANRTGFLRTSPRQSQQLQQQEYPTTIPATLPNASPTQFNRKCKPTVQLNPPTKSPDGRYNPSYTSTTSAAAMTTTRKTQANQNTPKTRLKKRTKKSVFVLHSDSENSHRSDEETPEPQGGASFVDEEYLSARSAFLGSPNKNNNNINQSLISHLKLLPDLPQYALSQNHTELPPLPTNEFSSPHLSIGIDTKTPVISAKDIQLLRTSKKERGTLPSHEEPTTTTGINRSLVGSVQRKPPLLTQKQNTLLVQRAALVNLAKTRSYPWKPNATIRIDDPSDQQSNSLLRSGTTSSTTSKPTRTMSLFYAKHTPRSPYNFNSNNNSSVFTSNSNNKQQLLNESDIIHEHPISSERIRKLQENEIPFLDDSMNNLSDRKRANLATISQLLKKNMIVQENNSNNNNNNPSIIERQRRSMDNTIKSSYSDAWKNQIASSSKQQEEFGYDFDCVSSVSVRKPRFSPRNTSGETNNQTNGTRGFFTNPHDNNNNNTSPFVKQVNNSNQKQRSPETRFTLHDTWKQGYNNKQSKSNSMHITSRIATQQYKEEVEAYYQQPPNHPLIDFILKY